jgi:hypothetical protein
MEELGAGIVIQIVKEYGCVEGVCVPMRAADGAIGVVSMVGDRPEFSPGGESDELCVRASAG